MRLSLLGLAVPGAIASVILAVLVLGRRTHLPRWTVVANPLLLVVLLLPVFAAAPAPIGAERFLRATIGVVCIRPGVVP